MAKLLSLIILALAAVTVTAAEELEPSLMNGADECSATGSETGACAVNALQRHIKKLASDEFSTHTSAANAAEGRSFGEADFQVGCEVADELVHEADRVSVGLADVRSNVSCKSHAKFLPLPKKEMCFCQLAGNAACTKAECACPQGCNRCVSWHNAHTVTFRNRASAEGCGGPSTVLLTISKVFFRDTSDLKDSCGVQATELLKTMLLDSWRLYQTKVDKGPVNQCFHRPKIASVKYLHMQTFCERGEFHAMPKGRSNGIGFCATMTKEEEVDTIARKLMEYS